MLVEEAEKLMCPFGNYCVAYRGCGVMEELKKCPFCEGEAEIISDHIEYEDVYAVKCRKCGASLGLQEQEYGEYRPCYLAESSAISAWNRRVNDA